MKPIRILFVCLGNIIRSPLAAKLFEREAKALGLSEKYEVDSAATSNYEVGNGPDPRMLRVGALHNFNYTHRARQVDSNDLENADLIIVMDLENKADIEALLRRPAEMAKIHLLREFDPDAHGDIAVPDPWYGGPSGFEDVYNIIERSIRGLLVAMENDELP